MFKPIKCCEVKSLKELKKINSNAIIIKMYSNTCPRCVDLSEFLDEYQIENVTEKNKEITIVNCNLSEQTELSLHVKDLFRVKSLPFTLYCTVDLQPIRAVSGFKPDEIIEVLNEYDRNYQKKVEF